MMTDANATTKTDRLFDLNSYLLEFDAKVLSCEEVKDGYACILDKTAFFPEEGGQTCDRGVLGGKRVLHVSIKNEVITHLLEAPLCVGETVHGEVEQKHRFYNMQQHSGEHIMSGLIHSRFGYDNVGFHLSDSVVTLDFNGLFTDEELEALEYDANRIISENRQVSVKLYSNEAAKEISYRSKKELKGTIRIVTIDGVDVCACCAPHVSRTGEIGVLKIISAEHFRGGTRMSILCGFRALFDFREKQTCRDELSVLLSVKPTDVKAATEKIRADLEGERYKNVAMQKELLNIKLNALKSFGYSSSKLLKDMGVFVCARSILIFDSFADIPTLRDMINEATCEYDGMVLGFLGDDDAGYRYIAASASLDSRRAGAIIKDKLSGKGGGKPEMITGSLSAKREAVLKAFEEEKYDEV